jgi:hypothetical protein
MTVASTSDAPTVGLAEAWPVERVAEVIVPLDAWRPYPVLDDRARWDALPAATRAALLDRGDAALDMAWPEVPATAWLAFVRTGDRGAFETRVFTRRMIHRDLVVAELVENRGRFLDAIADATWSICEESSWSWSACLYMQARGFELPDIADPVVDLGAGESAAQMAWANTLIGPALAGVSPLIPARVALEGRRRVIDPYLARDDFWWQEAVNNWNPWIHANVLATTLCLEPSTERRAQVVAKVIGYLDRFLARYPADGGCDEGATYWGRMAACLNECGELLRLGTGGAVDIFQAPITREIARFILRVHIAGPWYVNFADGGPRPPMVGPFVWRFGHAVGDPDVASLGAHIAREGYAADPGQTDAFGRLLPGLFGMADVLAAPAEIGAARDSWLPVIEVMTARARADHDSLFLAAKGGHNDEVHNHNDVGSFIVMHGEEPIVVDAGVDSYTRDTFSDRRYTLWTMQSGWHNVPVVNGVEQRHGREFASRRTVHAADDTTATLDVDLADAYPAEAGIVRWARRLVLDRSRDEVVVTEDFTLADGGGSYELTLVVDSDVTVEGPGLVRLRTRGSRPRDVAVTCDPPWPATVEAAPIGDGVLATIWTNGLNRIRFTATDVPASGTATIRIHPQEHTT